LTVFGDTSDLPSEIKKLHREIDDLRSKTEFQPILTTGRSDDGFGASVGSKTMNSGGVWSLTPVKYKLIDNPATGGTSYDMLELISACAVIEDNSAGGSVTDLELKTIRMASTNDPNASASSVTNSTPNGAILFIKPISGKTLTLKTGGNIHIDNDITLDEKGFAILQFYVSGTTVGANDEVKKKWIVLSGGGGSSVNSIKEPCRVATTGNNALHPVYNVTIDGVTLVEGQRLLVKNQTTARDNGIYVCGAVVAGASTFTRATDFDNDSEVKSGTLVTVNEGTANGNKVFMMTEDTNPIIVGTTAIYFTLVTSVDTALDYVWTGQHKFQGDPTGNIGDSNATHTVEFGNTGTDRIKFIGEITGEDDAVISDPDGGGTFTVPNSDPSISMKCAIVMNTYDIYDLDKTVFSQAVSSTSPPMLNNWVGIQANTGEDTTNNSNPPSPVLNGMSLNVPATKEFFFKVGKGTAGEEAEGSNVHEALIVSGDGIKLGDKISTPTGNGWLYLDGANMKAITGGATLNLSEVGTVKPDDEITWTDKHVWDNGDTWLESYTSDSVKATNCHVKIQGDGLEHDDYDYTDYDANPSQRVMEIGKYGTHEVKIIAEVTGHGNAVIVDPSSTDGTSEFTIPNSDPSISMKCALVMNTFSIYDLDQIVFGQGPSSTSPPMLNNWVGVQANTGEDTSGGSSPPNPTLNGMSFHVPDNKEFFFKVGKGTAGEEATGSNVTEIFRVSENGIKIAGSSAPSSPANGMIWHNSSDNKVYARSNGATVELGSGSGGGSTSFIGFTADDDLDMNTYDITNVDGLKFGTGSSSNDTVGASEYGMEVYGGTSPFGILFNVPTGKSYYWNVNGYQEMTLSTTVLNITDKSVNMASISSPSDPSNGNVKIFSDSDNNGAVTVRKSNGTEVNLESGGGGSTSFIGYTADDDLEMNTFDITGVDSLKFSTASNSGDTVGNSEYGIEIEGAPSSPSGIKYNIPSSKFHIFTINGANEFSISSASISAQSKRITAVSDPTSNQDVATKYYVDQNSGSSWNGNATGSLDMNGNDINFVDDISFNISGQDILTDSNGMLFTVPINDYFAWNINSNTRFLMTESSNTFYKYLNMNSNKIVNVTNPTNNQDVATKYYVDQNSGSSGADTSLSNLSSSGESHFDSRYLNDSGTQTKSGTTTFTGTANFDADVNIGDSANDDCEFNCKLNFVNNSNVNDSTNYNYGNLYTQGYITIKVGNNNRRIYYSAG